MPGLTCVLVYSITIDVFLINCQLDLCEVT